MSGGNTQPKTEFLCNLQKWTCHLVRAPCYEGVLTRSVRGKGQHAGLEKASAYKSDPLRWVITAVTQGHWSYFPHPRIGCHHRTHRAGKRNVLFLGPTSIVGFGMLSGHELDISTIDSLTSPWVPCEQGHSSPFLWIPSLLSSVFGTSWGLINFIKFVIKRWGVIALRTEYKGL